MSLSRPLQAGAFGMTSFEILPTFLYSFPRISGGLMLHTSISLPDAETNFLMFLRVVHLVAGITWLGLLYFFNLVNIPFMKELDAPTRAKIMPGLMLRAL